jgi:hypothetical protein
VSGSTSSRSPTTTPGPIPHFSESDQVLVIAGIEVTLPYGHFNVFRPMASSRHGCRNCGDPTFVERSEKQQKVRPPTLVERSGEGLRASINHPLLFPWEWTDTGFRWPGFRYLEVWNDPTWPENRLANPAALDMWTRWLNAGLRITAVGGSDFHNPEKYGQGRRRSPWTATAWGYPEATSTPRPARAPRSWMRSTGAGCT